MATYLIVGASRGIGLAFIKHLLTANENNKVIGTYRTHSEALELLVKQYPKQLSLVQLEATSTDSVKKAAEEIGKKFSHIDYLIYNSAIQGLNENTADNLAKVYDTNVIGFQRVFDSFLPLVKKSEKKVIVAVSSLAGGNAAAGLVSEIFAANNFKRQFYAYRVSKAALNSLLVILSVDYKEENIILIPIHPGMVETDMSQGFTGTEENPKLSSAESAEKQLSVIHKLTLKDSGKFFDYNGQVIPL